MEVERRSTESDPPSVVVHLQEACRVVCHSSKVERFTVRGVGEVAVPIAFVKRGSKSIRRRVGEDVTAEREARELQLRCDRSVSEGRRGARGPIGSAANDGFDGRIQDADMPSEGCRSNVGDDNQSQKQSKPDGRIDTNGLDEERLGRRLPPRREDDAERAEGGGERCDTHQRSAFGRQ